MKQNWATKQAFYFRYVSLQATYSMSGCTEITFVDGTRLSGTFEDGRLNGLAQTFFCKAGACDVFEEDVYNRPTYPETVSFYSRGKRVGTAWEFKVGGGYVVGKVDNQGELTGAEVAYVYPDHRY